LLIRKENCKGSTIKLDLRWALDINLLDKSEIEKVGTALKVIKYDKGQFPIYI
jgi:hypothetical protein